MDKTLTSPRTEGRSGQPGMQPSADAGNFSLPDFFSRENLSALPGVTAYQLATEFLGPVTEYMNRPRKNFRASLVEVGAQLLEEQGYKADNDNLNLIKDAVECLHAGSLIIDDIQDGSAERRGLPAFHLQYGTPQAICSGNWMYFWPLRLLNNVQWPAETKLSAYEYFHRALELAHYGQFLDLTTKAGETGDQHLAEISLRTAELKTGTITALAFELGALAAGVEPAKLAAISAFGKNFGLALQRLDDWGNLCSEKAEAKRFEDLITEKPTTVWHDVVAFGDDRDSTVLRRAVGLLPDQASVIEWLETSRVPAAACKHITHALRSAVERLGSQLDITNSSRGLSRLQKITEDLLVAYK